MVPRGEKHPTCVGFDEEGPTSSVRRGDARDGREDVPNELTALDGHEGPPLFPPINPLAVAAGELEESLLGPLPGGFDTRPRSEGAEARTVSLIRPGLPVGDGEVTPRIGKRCPRSPSRRRSSSKRHDQRKSDCRLRRRLASVVKEYQGIREELGVRPVSKAQDAHDSCGEDHAASNAPGGSQVQAKPKAQKRRTASSSASWTGSGLTSDTESEDLGLEPSSGVMEVSKQYPGGLLRSFLQTIGSQVVTTGDSQGALGEVRLLGISARFGHEVFRQDYKEEILRSEDQCRDESIGGGNGLIDGWPCGARGRHHGPEVPSSLEYVATEGGSWSKAKHLELAPLDGATSLTPGLRGDMNRQARRDQRWTGRPSNWTSREQDQNPSRQGAKGSAKNGTQWKSREGNQFGQRKQKGKQDLGEQRTGSWQHRVAGREKTQTCVGACSESRKRQAMKVRQ